MSQPSSVSSTISSRARSCSSGSSSDEAEVVTIPANSIGLRYLHDFLTADECAQLITTAEANGFGRSGVFSASGSSYDDPGRTSSSAGVDRSHPTVASIIQRVALLTQSEAEKISVGCVKYEPATFYKPHHDSGSARANPRRYTVLASST